MIPTTVPPAAPLVFNHAAIHNGPPVWGLVVIAVVAGLAGGALCALLLYGWVALRDAR